MPASPVFARTHKATAHLVKTYRRIGIEDLNVRGMARNRRLARAIMDGSFFAFRRQLDYKAKLWPQALRCQPVERNALARFARAA
jgi:IS605 OrfB family transposase